MPPLPYSTFVIDSPLAAPAAAEHLARAVEPERSPRLRRGRSDFEGEVAAATFRIQRIVPWGHPVVELRGAVEEASGGSRVRVTLALSTRVLVLLALLAASAPVVVAGLLGGAWGGGAVGLGLGLALLNGAILAAAFAREARFARRWLTWLLVHEPRSGR